MNEVVPPNLRNAPKEKSKKARPIVTAAFIENFGGYRKIPIQRAKMISKSKEYKEKSTVYPGIVFHTHYQFLCDVCNRYF